MSKKQPSRNLFIKKLLLSSSLLILGGSFYYFKLRKKIDEPKISTNLYAHYIIPKISPNKGPIIEQTFEKGNLKCITTYNITLTLPIYIKRYYPNEKRTEYLILKPIECNIHHINAIHELIQNSQKHIGDFEPQVVEAYFTKQKTRDSLFNKTMLSILDPNYLSLGIWYRKEGESTERLVGSLIVNPDNQTEEAARKGIPQGVYGAYFTGDPKYTKVRGLAYISLRALVDHMIYTGKIKKTLHLAIRKDNLASINIAEKLHMTQRLARDHYPAKHWPYVCPLEYAYLYTISVKKWKKDNWDKKKESQ